MARVVAIAEAAELLKGGEIVAFPTETVFGLGARADSSEACQKIFKLKGRPSTNPLIVHISRTEQLELLCEMTEAQRNLALRLAKDFWPGPLTLVLPASKAVAAEVTAGGESVGVRLPNSRIARELIDRAGFPLAAPSANFSNYTSPTSFEHVFNDFVDFDLPIVPGPNCKLGIESTVLSLLNEQLEILRPGWITEEDLRSYSAITAQKNTSSGSLLSPGQLLSHYAPRTPCKFLAELSPEASAPARRVLLRTSNLELSGELNFEEEVQLSPSGDYEEIARRLYSEMRRVDEMGFDEIVIEAPDDRALGRALMDRLERATSRVSSARS